MLGIILSPYGRIPGAYPSEISYSYGGNGTYLCPPDPQFNTQGEPGLYFDTPLGGLKGSGLSFWQRWKLKQYYKSLNKQAKAERVSSPFLGLGAIPTDAELSTVYQYTPVASGWVASKEAYHPSSWLPPNGWNQAGAYGPVTQMRGSLRDSASDAAAIQAGQPVATAGDVIAVLNAHNQRVFALTLVSTAAVAISAMLGAYRTIKMLRHEK